jgi:Peptidase family M28
MRRWLRLVFVGGTMSLAFFSAGSQVLDVGAEQPPPALTAPSASKSRGVSTVPDDRFLRQPLTPANQAYAAIDGGRIKQYVRELTAISRRYRDAGHQYWGRLIGLESDAWTAEWMADRLRAAGATNVRIQPVDLPPQWVPQSWDVRATGGGKTLTLASAQPGRGSPGVAPRELEAVWVGLGTEADFAGRDVRGKAAFIYGVPVPGARTTSASLNGAFRRASRRGAAVIFLVIGLPGNISSMVSIVSIVSGAGDEEPSNAQQVPSFTLGATDGDAVRALIEQAPPGEPPRIRVRFDVRMVPGLKTANVWGEVRGTSDEDIMLIAHRDGYFDAAGDNASGVATGIALAEYFAGLPLEKRRRTIRIVGTPGHHGGGGSAGVLWMAANQRTVFPKTAYLINLEHTAHARVELGGADLSTVNTQGTFGWGATGSPAAIEIASRAYDAFGIPRRPGTNSGGPGAEASRVAEFVPASTGLIHAAAFYHTDAETDDTIPAYGLEATARAYARIIDEVNNLSIAELGAKRRTPPPSR